MADENSGNGEDILPPRLRLHTLDEDPEDDDRLRRAYGTMAVAYQAVGRHMGELYDALAGMVGTVLKIERGQEHLERKVSAVLEERVSRLHVDPRRRQQFRESSSLREFNPDLTPGGGIKFSEYDINRIEKRIAELENERKIAEAAKELLAEKAIEDRARLEEDRKKDLAASSKTLTRVKVIAGIATPLATAVGFLIRHFWH